MFAVRAFDFDNNEWVGFGDSPQAAWDCLLSANQLTEDQMDLQDVQWFEGIVGIVRKTVTRWDFEEPEEVSYD